MPLNCSMGTDKDVDFGPMKIKQHTMSILLVFAKEDGQTDGFWWAADRGGYHCNIARNAESALESYLDKHHDLVIIDHRHSKYFDAEGLCRSIRATRASEHTVIMAVTKKPSSDKDKEETSLSPLIHAGFNRRFIENHNVSVCLNELLMIEHGELRAQIKLRAAMAVLTALENVTDAVEVTTEDFEIQYVNPAYETLFGYTCEELQGRDSRELPKGDKHKPDLQETMNAQLKKGKPWEGNCYARRKGGETFSHHCKISPVIGQSGKVRHLVKCVPTDSPTGLVLEKYGNKDLEQIHSGGIHGYPRRRESVARIHSMTIEAPINKVINLISAAQENSPNTVVQALDKVLEILRTSELYSPYFSQQVNENDQMTNDLIGGLMTMNWKGFSGNIHYTKPVPHSHHASTSSHSVTLSQVSPEVHNLLDSEECWDFHIFDLERLTSKRPLVYLGLKIFQRFGVLEFLGINETTAVSWLQMIESHYHAPNTYHNSTHAADVLHATAYFLDKERLKNMFDASEVVCALVAAIIHDLDHPGRTNAFLVNAGSPLALLYNDLAVLESHHVSLAFQLTQANEQANILKNVSSDVCRNMRLQIIDMVLATEMTKHFEHLNKFVSSITKPCSKSEEDLASMSEGHDTDSVAPVNNSPENRMLIKRMLIKCADVSNPARPVDLCITWANRIAEEYFQQTDEEKEKGLPVVMPGFDRNTCNVPKSQCSFIEIFIHDMFEAWDAFLDIPEVIKHLQTNYQYWKNQEGATTPNSQHASVEDSESSSNHCS